MKWTVCAAALAVVVMTQSCGDDAVDQARKVVNQTNREQLEFGGDPMPSPETIEAMKAVCQASIAASNVRDWDSHLDTYLPDVFNGPDVRKGWLSMAHHYDSIGWYTEFSKLDIRSVSPLVPYDGGQCSVMNADFVQRVHFGEQFTGIKEQYSGMMEERYGTQAVVKWEPEIEEYTITGRDHFYAFLPDTSDAIYLLQGKSLNEPHIASKFELLDLRRLMSYRD
ncbi:MAG: hypothetical protein ACPF83_00530 [Flavobacteriales bacterium]